MKKRPKTFIALLRGINVTGHHRIPMAELRSLCGEIGWCDVQSYIQSGNLVFSSEATPKALEAELEEAIAGHFGLTIPVIVRRAAAWPVYLESNPFLDACRETPQLVALALSKAKPKPDAVNGLRERAANGERVEQASDALWFHYPHGVARSKLTPTLLDRLVGSPVTARNWRTVLKMGEMVQSHGTP